MTSGWNECSLCGWRFVISLSVSERTQWPLCGSVIHGLWATTAVQVRWVLLCEFTAETPTVWLETDVCLWSEQDGVWQEEPDGFQDSSRERLVLLAAFCCLCKGQVLKHFILKHVLLCSACSDIQQVWHLCPGKQTFGEKSKTQQRGWVRHAHFFHKLKTMKKNPLLWLWIWGKPTCNFWLTTITEGCLKTAMWKDVQ